MAGHEVPVPSLEIERSRAGRGARPGVVLQQWHDNDGRLVAVGGHDDGAWWMQWPGLATFWFGEAGDVRVETVAASHPLEIQDIFARGVVPVVLLARGFEGLHASAVQDDAGVIGLCGTSGTGKSTIAFALASEGLRHFADDALVYRVSDGVPLASRIPFPVRIDASAREASRRPKVLSFARLDGIVGGPVRSIYLLRRDSSLDPRLPRFSVVPAARRFEALLAHAHPFEMGGAERRATFLTNLLLLARTVNLYECAFAPALEELPSLAAAIRTHARLQ
jgi:hypothetical protein